MNLKTKAVSCLNRMDDIVLHPRITAGISFHNKRTGKSSGNKSITLSQSATLLQMILTLLAIFLAMRALFCIQRMKRNQKMKKKFRAKWKKAAKKMSKS